MSVFNVVLQEKYLLMTLAHSFDRFAKISLLGDRIHLMHYIKREISLVLILKHAALGIIELITSV